MDSIYVEYFPDYANYFRILLRLNKLMYGMTNSVKMFADELANLLIDEAVFNQFKCKMYVYYKYAPDGSKLVVLSYVYDCVYGYTYD